MFSSFLVLALALVSIPLALTQSTNATLLPVHNITRYNGIKFENLAIRSNGQILTTSTLPNASVYQADPLGILPFTLIYEIPNVTSSAAIVEGRPDIFYVASGDVNLTDPLLTKPQSYSITEVDVRGLFVLPNGALSRQPAVKRVASLPGAALLNGAAFTRPHSDHLLVADSFRGLIWNVNVGNGDVGVTLNDTATKGITQTGPLFTGINGLKVHNGTIYWTNTGASTLYKVPVNEDGTVPAGEVPSLVAANLTCDDFVVDIEGNAYVAGPLDVITKVSPTGEKEIIAGIFNSTESPLVGPSAVKFGRLASDRWSLYVTTNGGVGTTVLGTTGISRIDLGLPTMGHQQYVYEPWFNRTCSS